MNVTSQLLRFKHHSSCTEIKNKTIIHVLMIEHSVDCKEQVEVAGHPIENFAWLSRF